MEEQPTDLAALLPGIAGQMRGLLSNLYLAAAQAIPAERREQDAVLDSKAAVLEQSFYRLLRMVNIFRKRAPCPCGTRTSCS